MKTILTIALLTSSIASAETKTYSAMKWNWNEQNLNCESAGFQYLQKMAEKEALLNCRLENRECELIGTRVRAAEQCRHPDSMGGGIIICNRYDFGATCEVTSYARAK